MLLRCLAVLLLLAGAPVVAMAQDSLQPFRLGVGVGYERGAGTGTLPVFAAGPECGTYGDGTTSAVVPSVWLTLPDLLGDGVGATLRLGWRAPAYSSEARPVDPQRALDPASLMLVDVDRRFELDASFAAIHTALAARISIGSLSVVAGPTVSLWLSHTASATDRIDGPEWARHPDGSTERATSGAWTPSRRAAGFGAVAELAYDLSVGRGLWIVPRLGLQVDLVGPIDAHDVTLLAVAGGIGIEWSPARAVSPPPPPPPPPPAAEARPTLALKLSAVDSLGREHDTLVVRTERVVERRSLPLVPAVFFSAGASELPERYVRVGAGQGSVQLMSTTSDALQAQWQILNIVGRRMAEDPQSRLTLVGSVSAEEPSSLLAARLATVREYLTAVWDVAPRRIATADRGDMPRSSEATEQGREENRRVELVSTSATLLSAVETDSVVERRSVPEVRVTADASGPIASWRSQVRSPGGGTVEIARGDSPVPGTLGVVRLASDVVGSLTTGDSLTASLRAITRGGAVATTEARLPVVVSEQQTLVEGWATRTADREVLRYAVLGFGYDSPALVDRHRRELATVAERIAPGASVSVTGYSDRLGDETRNLVLSEERARAVAQFLRSAVSERAVPADVHERGAGVDTTRFPNGLPEGRMLSRGVTIVIEQAAAR